MKKEKRIGRPIVKGVVSEKPISVALFQHQKEFFSKNYFMNRSAFVRDAIDEKISKVK